MAFARTGSRERYLQTLCIIASSSWIAFGAEKLFDIPFALDSFFAGMMMRESEFIRRVADEEIPLRTRFLSYFSSLSECYLIHDTTGLTVGVGLAQIGKFSFILSELGRSLNLLSLEGQNLILSVALISIGCNTPLFSII